MMRLALPIAAFLIAACTGPIAAAQAEEPGHVVWRGESWFIYDNPEDSRMIVVPAISRGWNQWDFALEADYRNAAQAWLTDNARACTVTGYRVGPREESEIQYRCQKRGRD